MVATNCSHPAQSCYAAFALVVCTLAAVQISPTWTNAKPFRAADCRQEKTYFLSTAPNATVGGTGNGSMASVLNVTPADLTTLDKRANGKFDAARGADISGHGTRAMPIWGLGLQHEVHGGQGGAAYSGRAVIEFKTYLQSVQKK